jgi:oligopeptide/dipeptide ABC transporter ATP-binding protein
MTGSAMPEPTDDPLLSISDLSVALGREPTAPRILDHVSLDMRAGETLGLVGESGSGKTTLGMAIMRLLPKALDRATSGEIVWRGRDILKLRNNQLSDVRGGEISMILQDPMASLNPVFTVGNQLKEGLMRHATEIGSLEERAIRALDDVGIPAPESRLKSYPHHMSGGMRQRVVGAIALTRAPSLLIADEPTTSLDVTIQYQVLELLAELRRRLGMAMLFITHDFGVVAHMCDRVAVMYAGQIVEQGPVRELFHRPAHWYTKALLDSVPRVGANPARLPTIPGAPPSVTSRPEGCRFHPRCPRAEGKCQDMPALTGFAPDHLARCWFPRTGS